MKLNIPLATLTIIAVTFLAYGVKAEDEEGPAEQIITLFATDTRPGRYVISDAGNTAFHDEESGTAGQAYVALQNFKKASGRLPTTALFYPKKKPAPKPEDDKSKK